MRSSLRAHATSCFSFFFLNDTAPTEIYPLPLHDALPISALPAAGRAGHDGQGREVAEGLEAAVDRPAHLRPARRSTAASDRKSTRLNSSHSQISYAVFCLKKKKILPQSFNDLVRTDRGRR